MQDSTDHIDIDSHPVIQMVQDTADDLDSDDEYSSSGPTNRQSSTHTRRVPSLTPEDSSTSPSHPGPGPGPNQLTRQATRRTKGMSLLPVRQSGDRIRVTAGSPPNTPGNLTGETPPSTINVYNTKPNRRLSVTHSPENANGSANHSAMTPKSSRRSTENTAMDNDELLSTYISRLATKEAYVGDLRSSLLRLQEELREAERDLNAFKENGKRLAEIVHGGNEQRHMGSRHVDKDLPNNEKDVFVIGKRMVDGIGSQFWSFLEDVKSATMGNAEFEQERYMPHDRPLRSSSRSKYHHSPNLSHPDADPVADTSIPSNYSRTDGAPTLPDRPSQRRSLSPQRSPVLPPRSPSPRQRVSPKRSIQNFIRNRSPSPIRNPLSPSRSPQRQEKAEYHASLRIKESERLSKKLSHLDLRAPHAAREPVE